MAVQMGDDAGVMDGYACRLCRIAIVAKESGCSLGR
jgi:hypothetical protein